MPPRWQNFIYFPISKFCYEKYPSNAIPRERKCHWIIRYIQNLIRCKRTLLFRGLQVTHSTQFPLIQGKRFFSPLPKTRLLNILVNFWTCSNFCLGDRNCMKIKACCIQVYLVFRIRVGRSIPAMWAKLWNNASSAAGVWFNAKELWEGHLTKHPAIAVSETTDNDLSVTLGMQLSESANAHSQHRKGQKLSRGSWPQPGQQQWLATVHSSQYKPWRNRPWTVRGLHTVWTPKGKHTSEAVDLPGAPHWVWHEVGRLLSHGKYVLVETVLSRKWTPGGSQWSVQHLRCRKRRMAERNTVDIVYLEFSKAFNTICHNVLVEE